MGTDSKRPWWRTSRGRMIAAACLGAVAGLTFAAYCHLDPVRFVCAPVIGYGAGALVCLVLEIVVFRTYRDDGRSS